ncbi:siroheme decarboxylase subunit beta [Clostridium sp. 'White wine YQ']|uniref:siroheme decarboxylase subunit beta n=1 Tax=Clostridium sp. 'White wine YQ' TaxID=3027474 RepID=UPI002366215C|nr:Lrp/AsnC family transcriptional regulator [Clostridium sp. 'White wine YQ']MDD7793421.1 Lrp/AsnC family transcriptional regulator [Clostridium sp. 'White wine YQ']
MFSSLDKKIIHRLQEDLPLVPKPYKLIADELEITENELLDKIKDFLISGVIRRFGATLNHRNVGFKENAMVVWNVPEEKVNEVGDRMTSFEEVSHCYERKILPNWKYNIYTMIHGESKEECEKIVSEISKATNMHDYEMLYSIRELKKCSMRYF